MRLKQFRQRHGHSQVPAKYSADPDLPRWMAKQRQAVHRLTFDQIAQMWSLGFHFGSDQKWMSRFMDLVEFRRQHGHCDVLTHRGPNPSLGQWLSDQRSRRTGMSNQRRTLFDRLGIDWSPIETQWNRHYADLKAFKEEHSHALVPGTYKKNPSLALWVGNTRRRKHQLNPTQLRLLERLGFDWNPAATFQTARLEELAAYKKRFGNCDVPVRWADNPALGTWVWEIRSRGARKCSKSLRECLKALEFSWDMARDHWWNRRFAELREYRDRFGNCNVPKGWAGNPALGSWVSTQRLQQGVMSPLRRRKLEKLGFQWKRIDMSPREPWEARYAELLDFKQRQGHCRVPNIWKENQPLASWVGRQRRDRAELTAKQITQLESAGFCWNARDALWDQRFEELSKFKKRYGHVDLCRNSNCSKNLTAWVFRQRHRKHTLSAVRILRLDELDFVWSARRSTSQ